MYALNDGALAECVVIPENRERCFREGVFQNSLRRNDPPLEGILTCLECKKYRTSLAHNATTEKGMYTDYAGLLESAATY